MELKNLTILIIDDDEEDILILTKMIEKSFGNDISIEIATSFQNGMLALGTVEFDICFLDYLLGEKTGTGLLKINQSAVAKGPVIMLTGQGDEKIAVESLKAGVTDYLTKGNLTPYRVYSSIRMAIKMFKEEQDRKKAEASLIRSEKKLIESNQQLEKMVLERTRALEKTNKQLQERSNSLDELNTALKVLLKKRNENQAEIEGKIITNIKHLITPQLQKLKSDSLGSIQKRAIVESIEYGLDEIVSPMASSLTSTKYGLTPMQIQISNYIKQGSTSKEIADLLNLSKATIDTHRDAIRIKLDIKNKKVNLRSFLNTIS